jgi:hypothetical protein
VSALIKIIPRVFVEWSFWAIPQALWVAEAAIVRGFDAGLKRSAGSGEAAVWRGRKN